MARCVVLGPERTNVSTSLACSDDDDDLTIDAIVESSAVRSAIRLVLCRTSTAPVLCVCAISNILRAYNTRQ